jgi:hypothetical protein
MRVDVVMDMCYIAAAFFGIYKIILFFNGFVVLGDSAYPTNDVMISILRGWHFPPALVTFNAVMCPIHTSIEWGI